MRIRTFFTSFLLAISTGMGVAPAQETVNYGSIGGRVVDASGGVVENTRVVARQTETNTTHEAVTAREGRFRFPYLRVGPYEVTARRAGFADAVRTVNLTVGSAFDLPMTLGIKSTGHQSRSRPNPPFSKRHGLRSP